MFSHGFGCDLNMWRWVTPPFEDKHQIVLFDHVGAGQSDLGSYTSRKYSQLQGYADDVLEICKVLHLSDVVFVGHSVSAIIGVLAIIKEPQFFKGLVLVSPSPCYLNDGDYKGGFDRKDIDGLLDFLDSNYLGWSQVFAPKIMGVEGRPDLDQELTNSFCRTDPNIAKEFARVTFLSDNRQDLKHVKVPSLILQCHPDAIAPREVGQFVHEQIAGSKLVQMKASGHCPNLSAPDETAAAMQAFLDTLE
jgi:sigma-B regulation protein RsbQ